MTLCKAHVNQLFTYINIIQNEIHPIYHPLGNLYPSRQLKEDHWVAVVWKNQAVRLF
jgi:hypothetical protein